MDSYMCYTHTIHQEAQARLHNRSVTAPNRQLAQHAPVDHSPQRRRLQLRLGGFLIAVGTRLLAAQPVTLANAGAITTPPPSGDAAPID